MIQLTVNGKPRKADVDPDTPLRFDHLLHLLTNLALCVAAVVGVTGAALIYWRLHSPATYSKCGVPPRMTAPRAMIAANSPF